MLACGSTDNTLVQEDLNTKIDQWHIDASEANYIGYFNFIADDGIFIGTDITERWTKQEFSDFSKPYFDDGKAWSFLAKERTIRYNKDNNLAWFDEVLDTWMGDCRATGIVVLYNNSWQLKHYQLSVTIDNDLMSSFLEINKANK